MDLDPVIGERGSVEPAAIDVSPVRTARRQLARAGTCVQIACLVVATPVAGLSSVFVGFWVVPITAVVVVVAGWQLSRYLRAGRPWAVALGLLWWLLAVVVALRLLPPIRTDVDLVVAGLTCVLAVVGACLLIRALMTALAAPTGNPAAAPNLFAHPWGADRCRRHPMLANKRRFRPYLLMAVALYVGVLVALVVGASDVPSDLAAAFGSLVGSVLVLAPLTALGVYFHRAARRSAVYSAAELARVDARPGLLYLRSFGDDRLRMWARATNGRTIPERCVRIRFEEVVTEHLWRYGPVVSLGAPADEVPPLGAARDYVDHDEWRAHVVEMMRAASVVVVVAGRGEGLTWEIRTLLELGMASKIVILLPRVPIASVSLDAPGLAERWITSRAEFLAAGLDLPERIDLLRTRVVVPLGGSAPLLIRSTGFDDWAYEASLDAAVEVVRSGTIPAESE